MKRDQALINIRRATPDDAQLLYRAEHVTSHTPGLLISHPEELSAGAFHDKIVWLESAGLYLVAELEGRPIGHALLEPGTLRATAHVFSLTIVVHPGYTGRGVGGALMVRLLEWAKGNHKVEKLELRVREGNLAAQRLYSRFGFVEEGRSLRKVKLGDGSFLADISMARFIDR